MIRIEAHENTYFCISGSGGHIELRNVDGHGFIIACRECLPKLKKIIEEFEKEEEKGK